MYNHGEVIPGYLWYKTKVLWAGFLKTERGFIARGVLVVPNSSTYVLQKALIVTDNGVSKFSLFNKLLQFSKQQHQGLILSFCIHFNSHLKDFLSL